MTREPKYFIVHPHHSHVITLPLFSLSNSTFHPWNRMFESLILSKNASPTHTLTQSTLRHLCDFSYSNLVLKWINRKKWRENIQNHRGMKCSSICSTRAVKSRKRNEERNARLWIFDAEFRIHRSNDPYDYANKSFFIQFSEQKLIHVYRASCSRPCYGNASIWICAPLHNSKTRENKKKTYTPRNNF